MKASTKTAAVSTSAKAVSKEKATGLEVQIVPVHVEIKSAVSSLASADSAYQIASTSREQTIIKLGELTQKHMSKHAYEITRLSLKPLMEAAFQSTNAKLSNPKPEKALMLYIGQQLARVMSIAYPGGKEATPTARKQAQAEFEKGKAANLPQTKLLDLVAGRAKLAKDTREGAEKNAVILVPVKKDENRGGHNAKAPIDVFTSTVHNAMTAAKVASIDREQMLVIFADGLIALEYMDKETETLTIAEE